MNLLSRSLVAALCTVPALSAVEISEEGKVDFLQDVYPILEANCLSCHGPDDASGEFRVDKRDTLLQGGGSGIPTVVPGDTFDSYMVEVLREEDYEYRMPQEADPLPEHEIAIIEAWIMQGGEVPEDFGEDAASNTTDLWSMQPVVRPETPEAPGAATAIDAFLQKELTANGLAFSERANPVDLIKRTTILLTGLRPTADEVDAFLEASAQDPDAAYEALVDRLLASPHFGERWAQHWLDVIRWAETNGSEANLYRKNAWKYRDYVINAFNEDLPYDQFLREQLAGDQYGVGVATGFLVAGPHVPAATVGAEPSAIRQARADRLDEIAQGIGASMLGVTVSCARCHNHKFDPISIKDYYSMTAVFEGIEFGSRYPELPEGHPDRQRHAELESELAAMRAILSDEVGTWQEDWQGWNETFFQPVTAKHVRLTFPRKNVSIDELEIYGPVDPELNLALDKRGTVATAPEGLSHGRGPAHHINNGETGTMNWRPRKDLEDGIKPSITLTFTEPQSINRLNLSTNRQYFLETDYLSTYEPKSPQTFIVEVSTDGETWTEVVSNPIWDQHLANNPSAAEFQTQLQATVDRVLDEGPQASFVGLFIEPEVARVFHRGSPENPKGEVPPAGLAILDGDIGADSSTPNGERRRLFAEWLTEPSHPLTSRVMVNRIWHHIFGMGIVPTPGDFGFAGALPSHPELLDWMAAEFVDPTQPGMNAWSVKGMIRQILLTDAFQQSSAPHEVGMAKDAGSMYLWRFPPRRIEAEVIRDSILQASGKLDRTLGGESYRIHNVKKTYAQWEVVDNHSEHTWRRMIYQERMRRVDDQIFTAFDFPDCGQVRAKRPVSTTPLQALNLMNSPFAVEQAGLIADRAIAEHPDDVSAATARLFELVLSRSPDAAELDACLDIAESAGLEVVSRSLINTNEFAFLP